MLNKALLVSGAEFSRLADITRPAVTQLTKSGKLEKNDGKYSLENYKNHSYLTSKKINVKSIIEIKTASRSYGHNDSRGKEKKKEAVEVSENRRDSIDYYRMIEAFKYACKNHHDFEIQDRHIKEVIFAFEENLLDCVVSAVESELGIKGVYLDKFLNLLDKKYDELGDKNGPF